MSRKVTDGHMALRRSEHGKPAVAKQKTEQLNEKYGEPCDKCGVRVARAVPTHPNSNEIEYPAGCHAIDCPEADEGSFHPKDPRT